MRPFTKREEWIGSAAIKLMSGLNTWLYRTSGGWLGGRWLQGAPILLLTTTGRKSGEPRTAPLLYLRDGNDLVLVASKGGMSHHPQWFRNLESNPDVDVEIGADRTAMRARRATEHEKATLWPRLVSMYSDFAIYQARTARNIPVVILSPR
jgi:deazaflavin-dependent oxidoreductase (nitroreductase family)